MRDGCPVRRSQFLDYQPQLALSDLVQEFSSPLTLKMISKKNRAMANTFVA
jgi:hypothetical protein